MKRALLHLACVPVDLLGLLVLGLLSARSCASRRLVDGVLFLRLQPGSWLAKRWHYSTTLGHVVLLSPAASVLTVRHELVHVRQLEGVCVAWALSALLSWSLVMVYLWPLAWLIAYGGSCAAAWLLDRNFYRDNTFEQHAYGTETRDG